MKLTPQEHLEAEIVAAFGRAAPLSLDHDHGLWVARAWSEKGYEELRSSPHRVQADAIRDLRRLLASRSTTSSSTTSSAEPETPEPRPTVSQKAAKSKPAADELAAPPLPKVSPKRRTAPTVPPLVLTSAPASAVKVAAERGRRHRGPRSTAEQRTGELFPLRPVATSGSAGSVDPCSSDASTEAPARSEAS